MSLPLPASTQQPSESDPRRPCVNFSPSIWGDIFLQYASESMEVNDNMERQAQKLKEDVKTMFQSSTDIIHKLNFIDLVQHFGVSYHFQQEINHVLEQIHSSFTQNNSIIEDGDFHSLALLFRLLRQQGYQISSNVFNKFKNDKGSFNETLTNDIRGLCNLYEASHLRSHEDDILEEAYEFSNTHLESLANQLHAPLVDQINHCLMRPLNKSVARFEARHYMTLYEQDPLHNETLLTFAKVDFNILQQLHQKEIGNITKWYRKLNIETKVPYARERLVEGYLWSLSMSYKPEYSNARIFAGKLVGLASLLDDTYDAYGTVQELELFTEAIQRWDISLIESLPECMKVVFNTVVELCEEIKLATTESGKSSFMVSRFKQAVFNLTKGYMVEAKWCHEGYIPTYDEYKMNGIFTSCYPLFIPLFIGLGEFATEDTLNWIFTTPNIIKVVSIVGRVLDDMASHEFEQQRVHVASSVECCIKQYDISKEEAYNLIRKDVEDCWKVINGECLKLNDMIPKSVLDCIVNLARMSEVTYENHEDKYTNGSLMNNYVSSLLMDPICID